MAEQTTTLSHDFLRESIKRKFSMFENVDRKNVGLELELFPFVKEPSGEMKATDIINEKLEGTYDLMLANSYCKHSLFESDQKISIPRLNSSVGGVVTFEPGGQIEYSSAVHADLKKTIQELIVHMSEMEYILGGKGVEFFYGALNPWQTVGDVGLKMKKPRYMEMDRYFSNIGPYGQQMMRLSGSLQVSLDFGHPEVAERRWLATNLISPLFAAIFGNSPFLAGKPSGAKSYRTVIWQNLDKGRTGFPHLRIKADQIDRPVEQYLEFALEANVFTLPDESGCLGYCDRKISFRKWLDDGYKGFYPTIEDWETHLTTLFPDVRAKGFMECRFIDGQAKPAWAVPAILSTALIYDDTALEKTISLLSGYVGKLEEMATEAAFKGVEAFPELCSQLFEIGLNASHYDLDSDLLNYAERFFRHFTFRSRNPADELLTINGGEIFTGNQYRSYEDRLFETIQPPEYLASKKAIDLAQGCVC